MATSPEQTISQAFERGNDEALRQALRALTAPLLEREDPWGLLVDLACRSEGPPSRASQARMDELEARILAPLYEGFPPEAELRERLAVERGYRKVDSGVVDERGRPVALFRVGWRFGCIHTVSFALYFRGLGGPMRTLLERLVALPAARWIQQLEIRYHSEEEIEGYKTSELSEALQQVLLPATIQEVSIDATCFMNGNQEYPDGNYLFPTVGGLGPVIERFSGLKTLQITKGYEEVSLGTILVPSLRSMRIRGLIDGADLRVIQRASWPELRSLSLEFAPDYSGFDFTDEENLPRPEDLEQLCKGLRAPKLERVELLLDGMFDEVSEKLDEPIDREALAAALDGSPLAKQVKGWVCRVGAGVLPSGMGARPARCLVSTTRR